MGLFKRNKVWWMTFVYQGRQIRRSTECTDRRLAEAVLGKIKVKLVEGRYFDRLEEQERTFEEMVERYVAERVVGASRHGERRARGVLAHLLPVFGKKTLVQVTPKEIAAYKWKRQQAGAAPATIVKELALMKTAFNIAKQIDDSFAPGVVIREAPLSVRDDFTSLAWLAGQLAYVGEATEAAAVLAEPMAAALLQQHRQHHWMAFDALDELARLAPSRALELLRRTRNRGVRSWEAESQMERLLAAGAAMQALRRPAQALRLYRLAHAAYGQDWNRAIARERIALLDPNGEPGA